MNRLYLFFPQNRLYPPRHEIRHAKLRKQPHCAKRTRRIDRIVIPKSNARASLCKIFLLPLPTLAIIGTLMRDVFLRLMEKCVFFLFRFPE